MWSQTKRKCNKSGCVELVTKGYCSTHQEERDAARAEQRATYWKDRVDNNSVYGLYKSSRWKELRHNHLAASPYCADCGKKVGLTGHVDHVVAHKGDPELFWNGPFQTCCSSCHGKRTASRDGGYGNPRTKTHE